MAQRHGPTNETERDPRGVAQGREEQEMALIMKRRLVSVVAVAVVAAAMVAAGPAGTASAGEHFCEENDHGALVCY